MSLYTCNRTQDRKVRITKFEEYGRFPESENFIEKNFDGKYQCSCPAYSRSNKTCRHFEILKRFQEEDLYDKGRVYSFEEDKFYESWFSELFKE